MYPTKAEFEEILQKETVDSIVNNYLLAGLPYSFKDTPKLHDKMLDQIARGLGVKRECICVVGSAKIGFSLDPNRFGEAFGVHSDIDVVVVSPELFDPSWINVLSNRRTPWASLSKNTQDNLEKHRCEHYIYKGWMYPGRIVPVLDIGNRWFDTFNGLSLIPELSARKIEARLYRTWDYVRIYHRIGLRRIRRELNTSI